MYKPCDTGKEKYTRFVLQWHQHCSVFLMEPTDKQELEDSSLRIWLRLTSGVNASVKYPVIVVSFCAAIFDMLLIHIRTLLSDFNRVGSCTMPLQLETESDDVYLRFCGAALAGMYQERYKKMKSKTNREKRKFEKS